MHSLALPRIAVGTALVVALGSAACDDRRETVAPIPSADASVRSAPAPSPLVTVASGDAALALWPYITDHVTMDPVNVLFVGAADPRSIRAALLSLSDDHSGFPVSLPCRWQDVPDGGI